MIATQNQTPDYTKLIAETLLKKDKVGFRHRKTYLAEQARHFTPVYRDFIYKIIKSGSLKISPSYNEGYIRNIDKGPILHSLSKRRKNKIVTDYNNLDTLGHELGHAADYWFGIHMALSQNVIIEDGKTLKEIVNEEFEEKHQELYELVMKEYRNIIEANINKEAYQTLMDGFPIYQVLMDISPYSNDPMTVSERKHLQEQLYKQGFVEAYYQLVTKKCYSILNQKYGPILDALSSKYNFDYFYLMHHPQYYYDQAGSLLAEEFFANVFNAKVTSKHVYYDNLIKYMPRSFNAFEKLFVIFYDHLQNNKRFNDVPLKKGDGARG